MAGEDRIEAAKALQQKRRCWKERANEEKKERYRVDDCSYAVCIDYADSIDRFHFFLQLSLLFCWIHEYSVFIAVGLFIVASFGFCFISFWIGFESIQIESCEKRIIANYQSTIPFYTISFEILTRDKSFRKCKWRISVFVRLSGWAHVIQRELWTEKNSEKNSSLSTEGVD